MHVKIQQFAAEHTGREASPIPARQLTLGLDAPTSEEELLARAQNGDQPFGELLGFQSGIQISALSQRDASGFFRDNDDHGIRFHRHAVLEHLWRPRCRLLGKFSRPDAVIGALVDVRLETAIRTQTTLKPRGF